MRELEHILPTLEPAPDGLARLQRAIAANRHPTPKAWAWAGAALAIPALALAIWIPRQLTEKQRVDALSAALQQAVANASSGTDIRVDHGAAIRLPSGQPNVRLYLVQSSPVKPDNGS